MNTMVRKMGLFPTDRQVLRLGVYLSMKKTTGNVGKGSETIGVRNTSPR